MLSTEFLSEFKRKTEEIWREKSLNPRIFGFQFQPGTYWLPGLSDEQIQAYENEVCIRFPLDFKAFLRMMNGTDLPTINIYGSSDEPSREWVGVYAYPRDLESVRRRILETNENRDALRATLAKEGFALSATAKFMPIYAHRCVVCDDAHEDSSVLSIWDTEDAIVYGYTLQEYLEREFLEKLPNWAS
jgi:hypothetical protein